jgi:hypothetical protein
MLSKLACSLYVSPMLADARLPTFSARNNTARQADRHEDTDPEVEHSTVHPLPLNMKDVSTKSSARMASAEVTTVRVIARDTPSAVGAES